jgi:hypothetical protein
MKTFNKITIAVVLLVVVGLVVGFTPPEKKFQNSCKERYTNPGELAGCIIGAYAEKHKLKRACNVLTTCATRFNHEQCMQKRLVGIMTDLSNRSYSKTYVKFTKQVMKHMDKITKTHPIHVVNSCREGRKLVNPESQGEDHFEKNIVRRDPIVISVK